MGGQVKSINIILNEIIDTELLNKLSKPVDENIKSGLWSYAYFKIENPIKQITMTIPKFPGVEFLKIEINNI